MNKRVWRFTTGQPIGSPCTSLFLIALMLFLFPAVQARAEKKCLQIASYHQGFAWQDLIDSGIQEVLEGQCELKQFYMDTKREPSPEDARQKALEAKALIESWQPDVVIVSDDNASRYVVMPYFKDSPIPFVFCAVNWTVDEYGYPYSNVTGMVEIPPIKQAIQQAQRILGNVKTGTCFIPDLESEQKTCRKYMDVLKLLGIDLTITTADTMSEFEEKFKSVQSVDVILMSNNLVLKDWDVVRAKQIVMDNAKALTMTVDEWMTPFTMLGFTQVGQEQGKYAASTALKILEGTKPSEIAIIPNREWNLFVNEPLLAKAGINIPSDLRQKGKKVE